MNDVENHAPFLEGWLQCIIAVLPAIYCLNSLICEHNYSCLLFYGKIINLDDWVDLVSLMNLNWEEIAFLLIFMWVPLLSK